ncbi:hypothetical protein EDC01DRAFT_513285 [Geopyxis carbonaria]|nr:hypothetical protein EDC01DRAFT_513285 [Geopyxis carbonaria]
MTSEDTYVVLRNLQKSRIIIYLEFLVAGNCFAHSLFATRSLRRLLRCSWMRIWWKRLLWCQIVSLEILFGGVGGWSARGPKAVGRREVQRSSRNARIQFFSWAKFNSY